MLSISLKYEDNNSSYSIICHLTFVDYCDKHFYQARPEKKVIKLAKGSLNNIFQDSFNKFYLNC